MHESNKVKSRLADRLIESRPGMAAVLVSSVSQELFYSILLQNSVHHCTFPLTDASARVTGRYYVSEMCGFKPAIASL